MTKLNTFDCIHIQYETSFFLNKNNTLFQRLCKQITKPLFVSLHEVYDSFPGVFPREGISGSGFVRICKEILYDLQHPYQTTYLQHVANGFFADTLFVHAQYHKDILMGQGITHDQIVVLPHPVKICQEAIVKSTISTQPLHLASHGFITPTYDFDLLFSVLEKLQEPWRFTWIGGLRRDAEQPLLRAITLRIQEHNWQQRFTITGWLDEKQRDKLLADVDIYCALFLAKSSSGNLATALGARKFIVATELPCTKEMIRDTPVMLLSQANHQAVLACIHRLVSDDSLQKTLVAAIDAYIKAYSYANLAKFIIGVYKEHTT